MPKKILFHIFRESNNIQGNDNRRELIIFATEKGKKQNKHKYSNNHERESTFNYL